MIIRYDREPGADPDTLQAQASRDAHILSGDDNITKIEGVDRYGKPAIIERDNQGHLSHDRTAGIITETRKRGRRPKIS